MYKGKVPYVSGSSVGAGDSLVAGLLYGMITGEPIEEAFSKGLAMGSATASTTGIANRFEMEKMLGQVEVKKMEG